MSAVAKKGNLSLWELVQESDPSTVKEVRYGARKFNTIDAISQIKKATEVFGPMGTGFGTSNETYSFQTLPNQTVIALYQAMFWYRLNEAECSFPIATSIEVGAVNKSGQYIVDDEFAKKAATDALTKGLSKLGFNADVFENKFGDSRYVEYLTHKAQVQSQNTLANNIQEPATAATSAPSDIDWMINRMNMAASPQELESVRTEVATKASMNLYAPNELAALESGYNMAYARMQNVAPF